jgi:hypothetical protein
MAYQLVLDKRYEPEASQYRGPAEQLTVELIGPPEQILPVTWAAQIAGWITTEVVARDGTPLAVKVWADIMPTWLTKYKVEYTAHASPLPWVAIIAAIAAIAFALGFVLGKWGVKGIQWGLGIGAFLLILLAIIALNRKR